MIYTVFLGFASYLTTRETDKAIIDDVPFRLHYTFTTAILFLSSVLISFTELVGKNMLMQKNNTCKKYIICGKSFTWCKRPKVELSPYKF